MTVDFSPVDQTVQCGYSLKIELLPSFFLLCRADCILFTLDSVFHFGVMAVERLSAQTEVTALRYPAAVKSDLI